MRKVELYGRNKKKRVEVRYNGEVPINGCYSTISYFHGIIPAYQAKSDLLLSWDIIGGYWFRPSSPFNGKQAYAVFNHGGYDSGPVNDVDGYQRPALF